jgi:hypothetical protein
MQDFSTLSQYEADWAAKFNCDLLSMRSDPLNAAHLVRTGLDIQSRLYLGRVVDVMAYCHCYKVVLENGRSAIPCALTTATSLYGIGAKQINTLLPGTPVLVMRHPQLSYGLILCVLPSVGVNPQQSRSDYLSQASRCGPHVDAYHSSILSLAKNGGVSNFSMGRPVDSTASGEWGAITETGLRVSLDSFMAQIAADEANGIFVFYNQLLRIAGTQLEEFSSGHLRECINDEGEFNYLLGVTPFPREQMGVLRAGIEPYRVVSVQETQGSSPELGGYEPIHPDQVPFHRSVQYLGYLGQGGSRLVQAPGDADFNRLGEDIVHTGLLREVATTRGAYGLASAKSITFVKRPLIVSAKRRKLASAGGGDSQENYKFAGEFGDGREHVVPGQPAAPQDTVAAAAVRAGSFFDHMAYLFNWEALHPFAYHENDWYTPEESELEAFDGADSTSMSYSSLTGRQFLDPPSPVDPSIDSRGSSEIYRNVAYFSLLDDGSVVQGCGYGSEIKQAGGSVFIDAPGDIFLRGRNIVLMSGRDTIVRANNSIDLSANNKDVRIKAENNMQLLAGNSGRGGILLESKANGPITAFADRFGEDVVSSGVMVKCKNSWFNTWTAGTYLRTGGKDVTGGPVIIDADKGKADIYTRSNGFYRYINSGSADLFKGDGKTRQAFYVVDGGVLVNGTLMHNGSTISTGLCLYNSQCIAGGHFASLKGGPAGKIPPAAIPRLAAALTAVTDTVKKVNDSGDDVFQKLFPNFLYKKDGPGNDDTIEYASFTYRTPTQMKIPSDYVLCEARWQAEARKAGEGGTWKENPVTVGKQELYPYPGKSAWKTQSSMLGIKLNLYDLDAKRSKDRSNFSTYEQAEYASPERLVPDGSYVVIE